MISTAAARDEGRIPPAKGLPLHLLSPSTAQGTVPQQEFFRAKDTVNLARQVSPTGVPSHQVPPGPLDRCHRSPAVSMVLVHVSRALTRDLVGPWSYSGPL